MSLITLNYIFSVGTTIIASQTNLNNTVIYSDYNGNITDVNISSTAAIEYTKLALNNTIRATDLLSTTIIPTSNGGTGSSSSANGANGVVVLNGSAQLPAVSGANLTGIGNSAVTAILGADIIQSTGTTYQASTDGFVSVDPAYGSINGGTDNVYAYSDSNSSPTTIRGRCDTGSATTDIFSTLFFRVRKNDYWKVIKVGSRNLPTVTWTPLGS